MGLAGTSAHVAQPNEMSRAQRKLLIASSTALWLCLAFATPQIAQAQSETTNFNLPAQSLKSALLSYSAQSKVQMAIPDELVDGKTAPALIGPYTNEQALKTLLAGTNLSVEFVSPRVVRLIVPDKRAGERSSLVEPSSVRMNRDVPQVHSPPPPSQPEELIVTGTRIRGAGPVGSEMLVMTRVEIEKAGFTSTQDAIRSLPQNITSGPTDTRFSGSGELQNSANNFGRGVAANLRGLGSDATLTLVNGHRMARSGVGSYFDISMIPVSAISRIEVLADGASAIYGSDAVAGVVNFILRKDFYGAETRADYGGGDGFQDRHFAQLFGRSWDSGNAMLAFDYRHRDRLSARDRDYIKSDLRAWGGADYRTLFATPGNIIANGRIYGIPSGQNGRTLTAQQLRADGPNLEDAIALTDLFPEQKQVNVFTSFSQHISDGVELFADASFGFRKSVTRTAGATSALAVPNTNPFFVSPVANATSVTVDYNFQYDLGLAAIRTFDRNYLGVLGSNFDIVGDWKGEIAGTYGLNSSRTDSENQVNQINLRAALADRNPASAFNPFGDIGSNGEGTLNFIRGWQKFRNKSDEQNLEAKADGSLFEVAGRKMRLAIGGEVRRESLYTSQTNFTSTATPTALANVNLSRIVRAAYAEVLVPLAVPGDGVPLVSAFEVTAAGRGEKYSDFGTTANPKVGVRWVLTSDVALRGSYGTSFKAPLFSSLAGGGALSFLTLADPKSATGQTLSIIDSRGRQPGDLQPETATTWTTGLDFTPSAVKGLVLSSTYFSVDYTNKIGSVVPNTALQLESQLGTLVQRNPSATFVQSLQANPLFLGTPVNPATVGAYVDIRQSNIGVTKIHGLDLSARYSVESSWGSFDFGFSGVYLSDWIVKQTASAQELNHVSKVFYPASLKLRASAGWSSDAFSANTFLNYVTSYTNDAVTPNQKIACWTTIDLNVALDAARTSWAPIADFRIAVNVSNLFDARAPFVNTVIGAYDPVNASPIGRTISLQLLKRW
jgi:iron complex outermembrane recepter protein